MIRKQALENKKFRVFLYMEFFDLLDFMLLSSPVVEPCCRAGIFLCRKLCRASCTSPVSFRVYLYPVRGRRRTSRRFMRTSRSARQDGLNDFLQIRYVQRLGGVGVHPGFD